MAKTETKKKIKIRLTGSLIGALPAQRKIVASLGLKKINQVVEHNQSAVIMGMINKVSHLVKIVEE
jgi:large subunit ribosomal protein L30